MKVTLTQPALAWALGITARAAATRSTLPVLTNVLLATDGGRLRLAATNLEVGVTCWVDAITETVGAYTVPAKTIADLVATYPSDCAVTLTLDEGKGVLKVQCGKSRTEIKGISAQEFPPIPKSEGESFSLDAQAFKTACQQVTFAATDDESRPVLAGVQFKLQGKDMTLYAADGYRLAKRTLQLAAPAARAISAIVPAGAVEHLVKLIPADAVELGLWLPGAGGRIIFTLPDVQVAAQLVDGQYPDVEQVIPKAHRTRITLPPAALAKAFKQAGIFAAEKTVKVEATPSNGAPGKVVVSAQSAETGAFEGSLEAAVEGDAVKFALNARYLADAMGAIKAPNVVITLQNGTAPVVLRAAGDDTYTHIIMPMMVANE